MDQLTEYKLTNEDIKEIIDNLDEFDKLEFELNIERIKSIIEYFLSIGLTNIKDIIITKPSIFYDSVSSIKERIKNHLTPKFVELINEDPINFDLIGI